MAQPPTPRKWPELQTDDRTVCLGARPSLTRHRVPGPGASFTGIPKPVLWTEMPSAISTVK